MSVTHIGHWPFRDETGTGPLATDGYFGDGDGCVIIPGYDPATATDFPFAEPTKKDAMWWFWKVSRWTYSVVTPYVSDTDELSTLAIGVDRQEKLICRHNGVFFLGPLSSYGGAYGNTRKSLGNDIFIDVAIGVARPATVDYPQVIYNSEAGVWIPNIITYVQIFDGGAVTGHEYTLGLTTDPNSTYYGGADRITVALGTQSVEMSGTYDGFGPAAISFSPSEFW